MKLTSVEKEYNKILKKIYRIKYPPDWRLDKQEIIDLYKKCQEGLATTNGDTAPVEISVRQLQLLLKCYD